VGVRFVETQRTRRTILRVFSDFCDSISISNSASPLIIIPPGQGLKSGGNVLVGCQHYSIPDGGRFDKDPKGFQNFRVY
jgi:hypothetical protein